MKRFTGHREPWGEFVDIKINAPALLAKEVLKKRMGRVWVSGVCDPYQPAEKKYRLSGQCLEILAESGWPVTIQTKSSLVLRDIGILEQARGAEVGFSISTADEKLRRVFEPGASPIAERIDALAQLHAKGIKTFAMIAPVLPGAEGLIKALAGKVDFLLVDRLNYHYANRVYRASNMAWAREDQFFLRMRDILKRDCAGAGIELHMLY
jgi:DNA repair photolyase